MRRKYKEGQEVMWHKPGDKVGVLKVILKVIPQKAIFPNYVSEPAVLLFTDGTWAFSWNCWPK